MAQFRINSTFLSPLFLALTLLNSGCDHAQASEQVAEQPRLAVVSAAASEVEVARKLRLTGTLRGQQETDLAANVTGRIDSTSIERGQLVQEGDVLIQVDTRAARLSFAEAQIGVETLRTQERIDSADCARYEKLHASKVVSDFEYDQKTAKCKTTPLNLRAAQAKANLAAKSVGDGVIRAPFSGVVNERYVEAGEYVQPSSRVLSLAQVDTMKVEFTVPERYLPAVEEGAGVVVRVAAYEQGFDGSVKYISGAVRDTRDVVVEATLPNPDNRLRPGMFAEVELLIGTERRPSVPRSAVFEENGKTQVFVVVDGHLEQRVVLLGDDVENRRSVLVGISAKDRVVTAPDSNLKNGSLVQ